MKRSFTGPLWLLLIFGLVQGAFAWGMFPGVAVLEWPSTLVAEGVVYWFIRRRNRMGLLSWTHAVILCVAFLMFDCVWVLTVLHSPLAVGMHTKGGRIVVGGVFWALVILAHAAFVQVLILVFRKPKAVRKEGGGTENILDDVIL
jgi:hypothetical protein